MLKHEERYILSFNIIEHFCISEIISFFILYMHQRTFVLFQGWAYASVAIPCNIPCIPIICAISFNIAVATYIYFLCNKILYLWDKCEHKETLSFWSKYGYTEDSIVLHNFDRRKVHLKCIYCFQICRGWVVLWHL